MAIGESPRGDGGASGGRKERGSRPAGGGRRSAAGPRARAGDKTRSVYPESGERRAPGGGRGRKLAVVWEDEELLAVDKPSGLPTIAAEGSRAKSLYDLATDYIRAGNPKGRAAVVHRLDAGSSGLLLFAKSARAKKALMEDWDGLVVSRVYVALAEGPGLAEGGGRLSSWLWEDGEGRVRIVDRERRGAKQAVTRYRVLERGPFLSLVELELETGRKHQIRVQLASIGHPVAGDDRYGAATDPLGRLALHARALSFRHPFTGEIIALEAPEPPSFRASLGFSPDRGLGLRGRGGPVRDVAEGRGEHRGREGARGPERPAAPPEGKRRPEPEWVARKKGKASRSSRSGRP